MNPWILLGIAIALVAVYAKGRVDGSEIEAAAWRDREIQAQQAHAAKEREIVASYRERERTAAIAANKVAGDLERELDHAKKASERARAAARAGTLRLRDPAATACPAGGSPVPETATAAGERDGAARGDVPRPAAPFLSARATDFLIALAGEADAVATQLASCQALVRTYAQ